MINEVCSRKRIHHAGYELDSLGVDTKSNSNELKDKQENRDLAEAIKQEFMEEYKQTYDQ
jgi:hypothetical protein